MIRELKQDDIEEIIEIWFQASSLAHPFLDSVFMENEKKNIREVYIPNTKSWVFEEKDRVEGFITMNGNEVAALFVRPEKHRQGIGKLLLNNISRDHNALEVEVFKKNKIGIKFYDQYGFKVIKEHTHQETKYRLLRMKFKQDA